MLHLLKSEVFLQSGREGGAGRDSALSEFSESAPEIYFSSTMLTFLSQSLLSHVAGGALAQGKRWFCHT